MTPSQLAKVRCLHRTANYAEADAYWACGWEFVIIENGLWVLGWMGELPPVRPA